MLESTLVIVKPDGMERGLAPDIITRITKAGLSIAKDKDIYATREQAERLYSEHSDKVFYQGLLEYIMSGKIKVMKVEGKDAYKRMRDLLGDTSPEDAAPGTMRADFKLDNPKNEKGIIRNLINSSTKIVSLCYESDGKISELVDYAEKLIFEVSDKRSHSTYQHLKEIIKDSIEKIDKLYQNKAHVTGIPTGFIDFDIKTAGLQPSDLIIVAGRPSMGKSAFALGMAEYAGVVTKTPVALFSLEMSKEQLVQRMLCSHAKVDAHKVRTGYLATSDWPRLTAAAGKLSDSPIFIDDSPAISVMELRAKARRLKMHHNIQLIILDYLQLMRGAGGIESRQQEISEISRSLKALARELNVPIVAISQLSRAVESRNDHRPQLSDLRESGAIEQDADVVVLILREEYYNPTPDNQGIAEIIIAKQRNGPVGSTKLAFIKEYTKFENIAQSE